MDTYENRKIRQQRDIDLDDENLNDDEIDDIGPLDKNVVLTPLPSTLCSQADTECQHYAHAECIERMAESGDSCPRCQDTKKRLHLVLNEDTSGKPTVKYPVYCKHIEAIPGAPSGFAMSSKLNRIVEHIRNNIPADDKILVLSFFKASLDLLEGIFEDELKLGCSRFDGDLGPVKGNESLEDFKTNPRKRILLATVQSGGTGLNITQAVSVFFFDLG
jgi:SNF2 family DNA or RNA helicase